MINLRITTDVDEVVVPATKVSDRTWRTDKLLLVPEGTTETYGDLQLVQASGGEVQAERTDLPEVKVEAQAKKAAFVAVASKKSLPDVKKNAQYVENILTNQLGWTVLRDDAMTKTEALAALPKHSLWYSFAEGSAEGGAFKKFWAFKEVWFGLRYTWEGITPQEVATANGNNVYELVFINGCNSADQDAGSLVEDFIDAFNAKSYVGWQFGVLPLKATKSSLEFFKALDGRQTVQQALRAVVDAGIVPDETFIPRKGAGHKIDLTP